MLSHNAPTHLPLGDNTKTGCETDQSFTAWEKEQKQKCSASVGCCSSVLFYSQWDRGPIVQMGWSVTEDLLCMADDGTVMVYDIHGAIKKTLSMGQVSVKSFCTRLKNFVRE